MTWSKSIRTLNLILLFFRRKFLNKETKNSTNRLKKPPAIVWVYKFPFHFRLCYLFARRSFAFEIIKKKYFIKCFMYFLRQVCDVIRSTATGNVFFILGGSWKIYSFIVSRGKEFPSFRFTTWRSFDYNLCEASLVMCEKERNWHFAVWKFNFRRLMIASSIL